MNHKKYKTSDIFLKKDRKWADKQITQAPRWCSVDLRDGNQALFCPMSVEKKMQVFKLLCQIGFREIEIGFPASSQTEYNFTRLLIEKNLIPENVTIQVLTQCSIDCIEKTFESVKGASNVIFHMYLPLSPIQRKLVFQKNIKGIIEKCTNWINDYLQKNKSNTNWTFQFSIDSFTETEPDVSLFFCKQFIKYLHQYPIILNFPSTVEKTTPNIFADQIEWMIEHLPKSVIISIHAHNDRGTAVASTELALLAGAHRVEGTLFGNGERTGNVDIITVAMNLYTKGIPPQLNFSNMESIKKIMTNCTQIPVHPRQPYSGDLVVTSFSGSHQNAINKCLQNKKTEIWNIPYLPFDPQDIGRTFQPVIRINSQSGKAGIRHILQYYYGIELSTVEQKELYNSIQNITEKLERELFPYEIWREYCKIYKK